MSTNESKGNEPTADEDDYGELLQLEEMESLLEELEEAGFQDNLGAAALPVDIRARLNAAGISNFSSLRARITEIHARLDRDDRS